MEGDKPPSQDQDEGLEFVFKPAPYLALTEVVGPMRDVDLVLVSALVDTLIALRSLELQGEARERAESAWDKLGEVFTHIEQTSTRVGRIFKGVNPWDESKDSEGSKDE